MKLKGNLCLGLIAGLCTLGVWPSIGHAQGLASELAGRIVLQVQQHGEAWYIYPEDLRRYYLSRPDDAFAIMRFLGLGITDANLAKIPTADQSWTADATVMSHVKGRIVLQVEQHGEAWYVNPLDGKRYYMGRPDDAFQLMTQFGQGMYDMDILSISPSIEIQSVQSLGSNTEEYVVIHNAGAFAQNLSGWVVNDGSGHTFTFPSDVELQPQDTVRVYTSGGDYSFGSGDTIWDDVSDTVYLYGERSTLIDQFSFNSTPTSFLINIPFTTQAPYGNWSLPYGEACEEAILVMLHHYVEQIDLTAALADQEILSIVAWEDANYGFNQDTSAEYTARTAREFYGLDATVSHDVTIDGIKQLISQGKPVIVPVYGKALYNPHYKNGGPYYHMILIIGYDEDEFITHDPGTMYGNQYRYNQDVLYNAVHDLVIPETQIASGEKAIVVVDL